MSTSVVIVVLAVIFQIVLSNRHINSGIKLTLNVTITTALHAHQDGGQQQEKVENSFYHSPLR